MAESSYLKRGTKMRGKWDHLKVPGQLHSDGEKLFMASDTFDIPNCGPVGGGKRQIKCIHFIADRVGGIRSCPAGNPVLHFFCPVLFEVIFD